MKELDKGKELDGIEIKLNETICFQTIICKLTNGTIQLRRWGNKFA